MCFPKHNRLNTSLTFVVIIGGLTQLSTIVESRTDGKPFLILMWNKWYEHISMVEHQWCSHKGNTDCLYTEDRNRINESDAIVFHWFTIDVNDLPKHHKSGQKWVIYNLEPPVDHPNYSLKELIRPLVNEIDWTMTFRKDSDIYVPYFYVEDCEREWNNEDVFDQKTKSISWLVSKCKVQSKREEYVKELSAYIKVDIYGKCGSYCPHNKRCNQMVYNPYKFYLSFENSVSFQSFDRTFN